MPVSFIRGCRDFGVGDLLVLVYVVVVFTLAAFRFAGQN
jgi:hypothetical protein